MRNILYILAVLFFSASELPSQSLTIFEQNSTTPVADAMIIQSGKLIGNTNEQGYCKLEGMDIKSKVCIKTFGFIDTCVLLSGDDRRIYLRPLTFETSEVNITAKSITPKEQLLKFLSHSVSLSNQIEEERSYRYTIEAIPYATELIDKMTGVFSYNYPSVEKRVGFRNLYQCSAEHVISKALLSDSLTRFTMSNGDLTYTAMYLYHLKNRDIKTNKKHLNEQRLKRIVTDSSFVFTYIDSTWYPSKFTWQFDKAGRLKECEFIQIPEEAGRSIIHFHGRRYVKQTYTTSGVLRIQHAEVVQIYNPKTGVNYSTRVELELLDGFVPCINKDKKYIPAGLSISSWAKLYKIPQTVVAE